MSLAAAAAGLVARYLSLSNHASVIAAVASSYLMMGGPIALILFLLAKRWLSATVAVAVTGVMIAVQLPLYMRESSDVDDVRIRLMTANLYLGLADAPAVVAIASSDADVLAVQELTPAAVERLSAAGVDKVFPHRLLDARDIASGVGLWSRYPITVPQRIGGFELATVSARIEVDGLASDPTIIVAHLSAPWPQPMTDWEQDMQRMGQTMRDVAATADGGCVLVAGDFNGTLDMLPFRQLLEHGYGDAVEQAGAGLVPTYPANSRVPPLIAIDHVLTHRCTAISVERTELPGSDHKGLKTVIEIPRSG